MRRSLRRGQLLLAVWLGLAFQVLLAGQQTMEIFPGILGAGSLLDGWYDVYGTTPPRDRKQYRCDQLSGRLALITGKSCFGIAHPLEHGISITDSVRRVRLSVTFLQQAECSDYLVEMALSSRHRPAGEDGRAFKAAADSGIFVSGYVHELQGGNFIGWRRDGQSVQCRRPFSPFAFVRETGVWCTWVLDYDHEGHRLALYRGGDSVPFVVAHGVDLDGCVFHCVWLSSWGSAYSSVSVQVERR